MISAKSSLGFLNRQEAHPATTLPQMEIPLRATTSGLVAERDAVSADAVSILVDWIY
jgi:hypothetical protein